MSLLKQLILETAAGGSTGAGSIAGTRGSLFGGGNEDPKKAQSRQRKMMRRILNYRVIGEGLGLTSSETKFDGADVISKIDAAEKKANANKDTVVFGLEDEDGGLVKVYVKSEQAEEFESALASMLAGEDDNEDDENTAMEIAEVLFNLKDKFEIVDVEWPTIEGDEEEEQEVAAGDEGDMGDEMGDTSMDGEDVPTADETGMGDGEDGTDMAADEESAKSALQQVIDVMKADADAKTAEAKAKEAEAKAKEAEYTAKAAEAKIKQEEEILDMESYYKQKSEKEKEAKQLAKLAKYKHDQANDAETSLSFEAVEDEEDDDDTITAEELAELIFKNLRSN